MRILLCGLVLAACATPGAAPPPPSLSLSPSPSPPGDPAALGRYLVDHLYDCGGCHTPKRPDGAPDADRYLAGAVCLFDVDPAPGRGCVHSRNLTAHPTGLANVVDDRAVKAMFLDGRRPDGKALHRAMPSWEFHNMPAEHADAIVAYLRTVPGVEHRLPASEPPFDVPPEAPTPPIPMSAVPPVPDGVADRDSAERGRVLAAAACAGCHTPPAPMVPGGPAVDLGRLFAGGRSFAPPGAPPIQSANLTGHATGLAGWSPADVRRVLAHGRDREGRGVCAPMPAGPRGPFGGLTDRDARDLASYIVTLPGIEQRVAPCAADDRRLSATGVDGEDVLAFTPAHELWSDGAVKRRWLRLPPGGVIDTSDLDHWRFPAGTRLWKEFARDGRRLETRMIEVRGAGEVWLGAYVWDEAQGEAWLREEGAEDVLGTTHDVPAASSCLSCHSGEPGRVLGFSAAQLPRPLIERLWAEGRLSHRPPPRPPLDEAAGYLHANCGHCHGETGLAFREVDLVLRSGADLVRGTAGVAMQRGAGLRVVPGRPDESGLLLRMRDRGSLRMPPLGTEMVDPSGVALVARWIAGLR